jgi:plasmid stabilization system protein ParE
MKFGYKLARSARQNLQQVSDYWTAEAGEEVALRIVTAILETIITLSGQPRASVAAEQFGSGVRKFAAGQYMIYYRPYRARGIEILHVFHGARDQRQAWKDERTRE